MLTAYKIPTSRVSTSGVLRSRPMCDPVSIGPFEVSPVVAQTDKMGNVSCPSRAWWAQEANSRPTSINYKYLYGVCMYDVLVITVQSSQAGPRKGGLFHYSVIVTFRAPKASGDDDWSVR